MQIFLNFDLNLACHREGEFDGGPEHYCTIGSKYPDSKFVWIKNLKACQKKEVCLFLHPKVFLFDSAEECMKQCRKSP
jgi:hypothetical protein